MPWRHVGEWMYKSVFLTSALDEGGWLASRHGCFTLRERVSGTHWTESWVGPKTGLDDMEKRKFLTLPRLKFHPLVVQPVARRYTKCTNPAPHSTCIVFMNNRSLKVMVQGPALRPTPYVRMYVCTYVCVYVYTYSVWKQLSSKVLHCIYYTFERSNYNGYRTHHNN
jgi:hypothetical protein